MSPHVRNLLSFSICGFLLLGAACSPGSIPAREQPPEQAGRSSLREELLDLDRRYRNLVAKIPRWQGDRDALRASLAAARTSASGDLQPVARISTARLKTDAVNRRQAALLSEHRAVMAAFDDAARDQQALELLCELHGPSTPSALAAELRSPPKPPTFLLRFTRPLSPPLLSVVSEVDGSPAPLAVVIDIGHHAGARQGDVLAVLRPDRVVALVVISDVRDEDSRCKVLFRVSEVQIRAGDLVATSGY